eukprot:Tamp_02096.p1 GENE.Tamp_02096~~Tamp_02096.p1  ORF type:complete len:277 (+),score=39.52 Tamp_02096:3288-4118(+)
MIEGLFRYMDVDGSGSITFAEFKHGVEKLDMNPRMVVTIDDFEDFVDYKSLHNSQEDKDEMNQEEFSFCMRLAIRDYICRLVSHQMNESVRYSKDVSTDYLAYKSMMTDMQQIHQILERLEPSQGQVSRRGSLSSDVAREGTTIANKSARNNLRKQGKSEGNDQLTDIQQQLTLLYQMVSSQQGIIQELVKIAGRKEASDTSRDAGGDRPLSDGHSQNQADNRNPSPPANDHDVNGNQTELCAASQRLKPDGSTDPVLTSDFVYKKSGSSKVLHLH